MNTEKTRFTKNPFSNKPISTIKSVKKIKKEDIVYALSYHLSIEFGFSTSTSILLTDILSEIFNEPKNLIFLSYKKTSLSRPTFYKAIEALVSKEMILPAEAPGMYWLNPVLSFSENKLTIIKEYTVGVSEEQLDMFVGE
jgi:hypothetical protein